MGSKRGLCPLRWISPSPLLKLWDYLLCKCSVKARSLFYISYTLVFRLFHFTILTGLRNKLTALWYQNNMIIMINWALIKWPYFLINASRPTAYGYRPCYIMRKITFKSFNSFNWSLYWMTIMHFSRHIFCFGHPLSTRQWPLSYLLLAPGLTDSLATSEVSLSQHGRPLATPCKIVQQATV